MAESEGGGLRGFLKEISIIVIGALIASTLLRLLLIQVFSIPSRSMESTLNVGDRVAVQKVQPFQRGDVVVFRDDLEWLGNPDAAGGQEPWQDVLVFLGLMPDTSSNHLVKRVIGIEGDHVVCCDASDRITVNGTALDETEYLYAADGTADRPSELAFDLVVPRGRIFVLGDHRSASADSRCHLSQTVLGVKNAGGFPSVDSVVGVAAFTLFPFDRWRTFARPVVYESVPSASGPVPEKPVVTVGGDGLC